MSRYFSLENHLIPHKWGNLPKEDKDENQTSLEKGLRVLSSYRTTSGDKIWVINETDRSVTTLLLPDGY